MKPIIVVHGIGGGDSVTKNGFSHDLKAAVISETATETTSDFWIEAAWEGVNDKLDAHIKDIATQLIPEATHALREDYPKTWCGLFQYWGKNIANIFANSMRKNIPTLVDYLLDFPLYLGEPRGAEIRKIVKDAIIANPHSVLVGHSLGSLICYDVLCEATHNGIELEVDALVTLGSPIGWAKTVDDDRFITVKPASIRTTWINFYYPNDPVCLSRPLDETNFINVTNLKLEPTTSVGLLAHTAYWRDKNVAKRIRALTNIGEVESRAGEEHVQRGCDSGSESP
ncbi:MAG: hypothetical protein GX565_04025 [Lentisphaerae bacterium]|nr:hypothetical protein [Lentisphaerota bacterium]